MLRSETFGVNRRATGTNTGRDAGRYVVAVATPAAQAMKDVVGSVTPLLRRAGFRKRRHTFNRMPEPGLVHVLNFQMGAFNPPGPASEAHVAALESLDIPGDLYGRFTINLGVYVAGMVIEG